MNLRTWLARLLALFRKRRLEEELNEDIRSHLEMVTEENLRRGDGADERGISRPARSSCS
jgi:hypothetical protein